MFNALGRISREEGVKALWRGFEPTVSGTHRWWLLRCVCVCLGRCSRPPIRGNLSLPGAPLSQVARAIAMNVGMMATYDISKGAITKINGDNFTTQLLASATAAIACVVTSLPFDMIKVRACVRACMCRRVPLRPCRDAPVPSV